MTAEQVERLKSIFRVVLKLPGDAEVDTLRQESTETWDSLAHVSLVVGLESEFGVSLDTADSLGITSYAEAMALLEAKGL